MKILVIDNYDSFTYNLVHLVQEVNGEAPHVMRNNEFEIDFIKDYDALVLSPGPGLPNEAGNLMEVIKNFASEKKILGVCLGHQAIGEAFGAELKNLKKVFHGKETTLKILRSEHPMFKNIKEPCVVGRYHSWTISKKKFPDCLEILAEDETGEIMAVAHKTFDIWGVQFHPESIMTPAGKQLISNWLQR